MNTTNPHEHFWGAARPSAKSPTIRWHHWLVLLVLLGIAGGGIFWGLGKPMLWEDEAETALVGRNTIRYGYPTPWDGETFITQQEGYDARQVGDKLLWTWHPPLQYYLAGVSLRAFGESPWSARIPFALAGFLGIAALAAAAWTVTHNPRMMLITTTLAVFSVPLYLMLRQARYYALLFLAGALVAWGIARLRRERMGGIMLVGVGTIIAVLSHTLAGLVLTVLAAVTAFLEPASPSERGEPAFSRRKEALKLLLALLPTFAVAGVWLWLSDPFRAVDRQLPQVVADLPYAWVLTTKYHAAFFPALGWVGLLFFLPRKELGQAWYVLLAPLLLVTTVWVLQVVGLPPFTRYLLAVAPLTFLVLGYVVWRITQWSGFVGFLLLLVMATTTIAGNFPRWIAAAATRRQAPLIHPDGLSYLPRYLEELRESFPGTLEGVSAFLAQAARPDDAVLTNYEREALQFASGLRVLQDEGALSKSPQWLLPRPNSYLWTFTDIPPEYEEFILDVPNTPVENSPELGEHYFTPPPAEPLKLYHLRSAPLRSGFFPDTMQ